ncbi:MAG: adenosylcobalamin-dependent ribonucleoside-diphosphate reductase [Planctomycetes bacterium]|nr:adenosylcobalamin-dependent ribonucleoside-diphosphate reductase [Planctomycetota bacterium]
MNPAVAASAAKKMVQSPLTREDALRALESIDPPRDLIDPQLTENAVKVLSQRYLKKDLTTGKPSETPRQLFWRVASCIARPELTFGGGTPERALAIAREFYDLMARKLFMPNSPTLMNAGREMGMLSACFVLPVEDSIEGIFDSIKATALIQKAGGGTGFSFSRLRPQGDVVKSSGGTTEGPLSFIQVFSKATDAIQQGAFRRGANMGILRVDHPDVISFITIKDDLSKLQNYNISVTVTDKFIQELRSNPRQIHMVQNPRTKEWKQLEKRGADGKVTGEFWTVGEIWDLIVDHAWRTGEPGVVFIDRVNARNPIKNVGLIEATNPCGEQPLHPYDSCNLGSINLGLFVRGEGQDARFDWDEYKAVIHTTTRFLDNVIEANKYPLPQIDNMSKTTRRIGLGVMGFADALFKLGLAYDSPEGCAFGEQVMRVMNDESHLASELLAEERGVFPAWEGSDWQKQGRRLRNSYTTTVAPTGTISIIADCSGGIEPMFSLAFIRQVMKDTSGKPTVMREVNYVFEDLAKKKGFWSDALLDQLLEQGSLKDIEVVPAETKRVFVTARDITPHWHMKMQSAFQRHCDSSISKTINFPHEATRDDIRSIFELAVDEDVKGVTVYRDGCRDVQPMALKGSTKKKEAEATAPAASLADTAFLNPAKLDPQPVRLPEIMPSLRIRQMTPFGNMHVKISVDPVVGKEREVFAQLGKGGDVANSDLEAICRILSLWLRSNGSLELALKQLEGIGSSLSVPTRDGRIMSLPDGLAKAIHRYLDAKHQFGLEALLLGRATFDGATGATTVAAAQQPSAPAQKSSNGTPRNVGHYKLKCPACEGELAFMEGCVKCHGCGFSQC